MNELAETEHTKVLNRPTKKQIKFIEAYFTPGSGTYGNAYKSGLASGYSDRASRNIVAKARGLEWVQNAMKLYAHQLEPEHIYLGMQKLALEAKQDRDKLRALELMAKIRGMFVERSQSEVNVTFNNAVPRPIITVPQEHIPTTEVKEQQEGEGI